MKTQDLLPHVPLYRDRWWYHGRPHQVQYHRSHQEVRNLLHLRRQPARCPHPGLRRERARTKGNNFLSKCELCGIPPVTRTAPRHLPSPSVSPRSTSPIAIDRLRSFLSPLPPTPTTFEPRSNWQTQAASVARPFPLDLVISSTTTTPNSWGPLSIPIHCPEPLVWPRKKADYLSHIVAPLSLENPLTIVVDHCGVVLLIIIWRQ